MKTLLFLTLLVCILAIALSQDAPKKCNKFTVKKYKKCLDKGFPATIAGCTPAADVETMTKKKKIRKCRSLENKLKECGIDCDGDWFILRGYGME